ncbi:carbohydrate ABC transporter substrate-binding protein, CUT1 family [Rhizobiales bacterium GAS188]|nr:carbohydrate ABC transporter substrate-binding protein, CUT1 family [Rhizobiales bacterium GAS188]
MKLLRSMALAGSISMMAASGALAATKIDFFFPVPVDGALAKEMQNLVARFNKENPDIEVTAAYTGTYDDTDLKTRAAIKAGKPPAVSLMSANFITQYHIDDLAEPFDPLVVAEGKTPDAFMNQFWPALSGNARVDGKIYGVPFHNSTPLLYYNVEHFKEAGLDPDKPPVTWADWVEDAKKLTKRDGDKTSRYGLMISGTYDILGWVVSSLVMSNGGLYYNPEYGGEIYYDTPSTLGAVSLIDDLVHKHKVMPEGIIQTPAMNNAFFGGQVSMIISSTGSLSFIRQNMKTPFRVAFIPRNVRNAVPIGGASLIIPKGNSEERKQAAWKLIKWLTSLEISGGWSRFTGYFAPPKAAYDLPEMKEFLDKNPDAKVALEQLPYARPWFATYNTVAVRKALEDEVQAVISGKKTPADAVKAAQASADALLKGYVEATALNLPK